MVNVAQLGWVMVGMLLAICNCRITTPQFQEQRLNIVYPDLGSVIFLDGNHETLFNIPCAEGERRLKTFIKALDHSGQMFSLEKTFSDPVLKNENIGIYKIKKDDYIKL